jgi:hypothetical protein
VFVVMLIPLAAILYVVGCVVALAANVLFEFINLAEAKLASKQK